MCVLCALFSRNESNLSGILKTFTYT